MEYYKIIDNDVLEIVPLIKSIDSGYFVVYNLKNQQFELHHNKMKPTFQLVFDEEQLTYRSYLKVYHTRMERIKELEAFIEKENERKENERVKKAIDQFENSL